MGEVAAGESGGLELTERVLFLALGCWLATAAFLTKAEYYDGFDSILNSLWFMGRSDYYIANRGPLMSLFLVPAEFLKRLSGLSPLNTFFHHLMMAGLHFGYLLGTYLLLSKMRRRCAAVFTAFVLAVPNFIFFSYAPFIRDDIFPGFILLSMLHLANRQYEKKDIKTFFGLIVLGALAALIKHTYAIFWISLVFSFAIIALVDKTVRNNKRFFMEMIGGCALSGILTWLILSFVLSGSFPDKSFLARPYFQLAAMTELHHDSHNLHLWLIYLRNFWAYGVTAAILLPFGLYFSLKGAVLEKSVALTFIICLVAMHFLSKYGEVRYIAFLAPLTAFLIVTPLQVCLENKKIIIALCMFFMVDLAHIIPEAMLICSDFYTRDIKTEFFKPIESEAKRVAVDWELMSFVPPGFESRLTGDRYHHIFHLGWHHLMLLYGFTPQNFFKISGIKDFDPSWLAENGTVFIHANSLVVNNFEPPYQKAINSDIFEAQTYEVTQIELRKAEGEKYTTNKGEPFFLSSPLGATNSGFTLKSPSLEKDLAFSVAPYLLSAGEKTFPMERPDAQTLVAKEPGAAFPSYAGSVTLSFFELRTLLRNGIVAAIANFR